MDVPLAESVSELAGNEQSHKDCYTWAKPFVPQKTTMDHSQTRKWNNPLLVHISKNEFHCEFQWNVINLFFLHCRSTFGNYTLIVESALARFICWSFQKSINENPTLSWQMWYMYYYTGRYWNLPEAIYHQKITKYC